MQIDWITVSAQIVNFLILVWLLKRFLYQPVLDAIDARELRITTRLSEAQEREYKADETIRRYQQQSSELTRERDKILTEAEEEAESKKRQMIDDAREDVAGIRANWQRQANDEKEEFLESLRRQAADAIQILARKALADLADAELEERIVHTFIGRLNTLDKDTRKAMMQTEEPMHVSSAFELDHAVRSRLTRAIHEHLDGGIELTYSLSPELLCGLELSRGGQRLSWNMADYMDEVKEHVHAAFAPAEAAK